MDQCFMAIEAAEKMNHPFSKALTKSFASWLYQFNGDSMQTQIYAQQVWIARNGLVWIDGEVLLLIKDASNGCS
jgi:hypothetical protein